MSENVKPTEAPAPQGGALVPDAETKRPATLYDPSQHSDFFWVSFPVNSEEGFARLMSMRYGESKPLADHIGQIIRVRNVFVQGMEKEDEKTGEVVPYPRIVLELEDGSLVACGSHGVFASIRDILRFRPVTPWEPPVSVKVVSKNLPGGHRFFVLLYVAEVPSTVTPGGNGHGRKK